MLIGRTRIRLAKQIEELMGRHGYVCRVEPSHLIPATGFYRTSRHVDGMPWEGTMDVLVGEAWKRWTVCSWNTMTELTRKGRTMSMSVDRWTVEIHIEL